MQISKNSMIYQSYKFCDKFFPSDYKHWMPQNLCQFMRAYGMRLAFFAFGVYMLAGGLVGFPALFLTDIIEYFPATIAFPATALFIVLFTASLLGVMLGTIWCIITCIEQITKRKSVSNSIEIVSEYVKSKTRGRGYCATIEYKE